MVTSEIFNGIELHIVQAEQNASAIMFVISSGKISTKASIFLLLFCISLTESIKTYTIINKNGWNAEIKKCWSGKDDYRDYIFDVGNLSSLGLPYESLSDKTVVKILGKFKLYTKATGQTNEDHMLLNSYELLNDSVRFSGEMTREGTIGWGTQITKIICKVTFYADGKIRLENYAYAGSWYSISCAETNSKIIEIDIYN